MVASAGLNCKENDGIDWLPRREKHADNLSALRASGSFIFSEILDQGILGLTLEFQINKS